MLGELVVVFKLSRKCFVPSLSEDIEGRHRTRRENQERRHGHSIWRVGEKVYKRGDRLEKGKAGRGGDERSF